MTDNSKNKLRGVWVHMLTNTPLPDDLRHWFVSNMNKIFLNNSATTLDEAFNFTKISTQELQASKYKVDAYYAVCELLERKPHLKTSNQDMDTFREAAKDKNLPISAKKCAKYYREIKHYFKYEHEKIMEDCRG